MVNVKDESFILMIGIPPKEWDDLLSPGIVFFHTSSQEFFQTETITDKIKEALSQNKGNARISKSYVNVVNAISAFVEPTTPTNIIRNKTILT